MDHPDGAKLHACLGRHLPALEQAEVERHLSCCETCQEALAVEKAFDAELREAYRASNEPLPPHVEDKVLARLTAVLGDTARTARTGPMILPSHPDAPAVPDYRLIEKIGEGAYGAVWRAEDLQGIACAVKVMPRHARHSPGEKELTGIRQLREKEITHENLIRIHHVGSTAECWYYVMDLVDETLEQRLSAQGSRALPAEETRRIAIDLLRVLSACHQQQIAHRDIKPANIGFRKGVLKLLDLGLVTTNRTDRTWVGTPDYMPHKPSSVPAQDDLYAVGMLLYTMLTGNHPDQFPSLPASVPQSPVYRELNRIVCQACDRDPANRFQTAEAFLSALEAAAPTKKHATRARITRKPRIPRAEGLGGPRVSEPKESTMKEHIQAAVKFLQDNNLPVSDRLAAEMARLQAGNYKIAVVGKFQVGKSKLINEVFIRDQVLLKEGEGLPKTAVATEVVFGTQKKLEVFEWVKETVTIECGSEKGEGVIRTGELRLAKTIDDPTESDLAEFTTAAPGERVALTQRVGGVRLYWPCESLRKFTVFDTPGVDDPDQVLLANTTYRVIPQTDAAILVVPPRMLDTVELELLRSGLFAVGINRLMVLISYNPDTQPMAAGKRVEVMETIRAQLSGIGRGYIAVSMVCYAEAPSDDVLATPDAIEKVIVEFAEANVAKGRMEKAARLAAADLRQAINTLNAQLASADKTDAERLALLKEAKQKKEDLRSKYNQFAEEYLDGLKTAQQGLRDRIYQGLDRIAAEFNAGFDSLTEISAVQTRLANAAATLRPPIDDLFMDEGKEFKQKMDAVAARFQSRFRDLPDSFTTVGELHIDGGILAKVPSLVLTIADYLLADFILPGGIIIGSIIRYIAGKMPLIGRLMPARLVTRLVISNVKGSVERNFSEMEGAFCTKLDDNHAAIKSKLGDGFDSYMAEELEPVLCVLSQPVAPAIDKGKIAATITGAQVHEAALAVIAA